MSPIFIAFKVSVACSDADDGAFTITAIHRICEQGRANFAGKLCKAHAIMGAL